MQSKLPARTDHAQQLGTESSRRRSKRVLLSIPITVKGTNATGKEFHEDTRTLVVNAHGALIDLKAQVKNDQTVTIVSRATNQSSLCHVVFVGNAQGGK